MEMILEALDEHFGEVPFFISNAVNQIERYAEVPSPPCNTMCIGGRFQTRVEWTELTDLMNRNN